VFAQPAAFETARITPGDLIEEGPCQLPVRDEGAAVRIRIDTGGLPFTIRNGRIDEAAKTPVKPLRLGIALKDPIASARIAAILCQPALMSFHIRRKE